MARILDILFFFYFLTHIPIAMFVDSQAVIPQRFYPTQLVELKNWYCREFRDPMMVDPPAWFCSFIYCEVALQFPFFFIATYAFFKGAAKACWIRIPAIIYSAHVVTTMIPILLHILTHNFTGSKHPGPRTSEERLTLVGIYSPYLLLPIMILLDASLSSAYREPVKAKRG